MPKRRLSTKRAENPFYCLLLVVATMHKRRQLRRANQLMLNENLLPEEKEKKEISSEEPTENKYVLVPKVWLDQICSNINELRQEIKNLCTASIYNKDILDMKEAAIYTGLSTGYLYKLVSRREISCYKAQIGHKNFFKKEELNSWLLAKKCLTKKEIEQQAAAYTLKNPVMRKTKNK